MQRGNQDTETYKIFISHSSIDTWVADRMREKIEGKASVTCFLDARDIKSGDDFENQIFFEIEFSEELVALITPWSLNRNWIWIEIGAARALGKRIIPILYGTKISDLYKLKGGYGCVSRLHCSDLNDFDRVAAEIHNRSPRTADAA